jgi:Na+/H+ antiporter NhaD/arsenite permease-like protein
MVADPWNWDMAYMLTHFGWRASLAVVFNAAVATWWFRRQLKPMGVASPSTQVEKVPRAHLVLHLLFLAGVVLYAHHPAAFMGLFVFFLGYSAAYRRYQDRLILREALLVAFFLAGLVVLGGLQEWWLRPVLMQMSAHTVFFGATALTALTDNAALTYLGSLVPGLAEDFKQALVAGAVTGGGLTVIANAPNPAGVAILRGKFENQTIQPLWLLAGALLPTLVAALAFRLD